MVHVECCVRSSSEDMEWCIGKCSESYDRMLCAE